MDFYKKGRFYVCYAAFVVGFGITLIISAGCKNSHKQKSTKNDAVKTDTVWVLRKTPSYNQRPIFFMVLGDKNNKIYTGKFDPSADPISASAEIGDKLVITNAPENGEFNHFSSMKAVKNLTAEAQLKEFANQR